jgi:hypothetical protein
MTASSRAHRPVGSGQGGREAAAVVASVWKPVAPGAPQPPVPRGAPGLIPGRCTRRRRAAALFLAFHANVTTGTELPSTVGSPSSFRPRAPGAGASSERGDDEPPRRFHLPIPLRVTPWHASAATVSTRRQADADRPGRTHAGWDRADPGEAAWPPAPSWEPAHGGTGSGSRPPANPHPPRASLAAEAEMMSTVGLPREPRTAELDLRPPPTALGAGLVRGSGSGLRRGRGREGGAGAVFAGGGGAGWLGAHAP